MQISSRQTQTAQANIFQNQIRRLVIPIPCFAEQHRVTDALQECFEYAEQAAFAIDNEMSRSNHLRQAILKAAFEGKLVPQDPTDEPASALLDRIRATTQNPKKPKKTKGR
jgi:type I restriction enzyme, S subunit